MVGGEMKDALLGKLAKELNDSITSERQAVYILVLLRKLIELNGHKKDPKYFALNFYCSWAVHTKMSRDGALEIVKRFNRYQQLNELAQASTTGTVTIPVS